MPLSPPITLNDARNSVAIRAGLATSGTLANNMRPMVDEAIRAAQRLIYMRATWARLWATADVALAAGINRCDLPSGVNLGQLGPATVVHTDGHEEEVAYDDNFAVRRLDSTGPGRPRFWRIIDQEIVLAPPPSADWPTLRFRATTAVAPLVGNDDPLTVDGEAVIQLATIRVKEYLGVGGKQEGALEDLRVYLEGLRGEVAPSRAYGIASEVGGTPPTGNEFGDRAYTVDWNPW